MNSNSGQKNIEVYISAFPEETRNLLTQLWLKIKELAPAAEESISYGIPTFKLNGNLVHFAGYKNHIGFYPTPEGIKKFARELSGYKQAKGSVRFPLDKPVPWDLISEIVKFRIAQNAAKATAGKK